MVGDVKHDRVQLHQRFAFFDSDVDDDGFTALVKAGEKLAPDFEGGRTVRSAFFGFRQGRRNLADGFPRDCVSFAGAFHTLVT